MSSFSDLFPNAYHIARREYMQRVRNRTFAVLTIGLAIVALSLALLPLVIRVIGGDRPTTVAVSVTATNVAGDPADTLRSLLTARAASSPSATGTGSGSGGQAPPAPKFTVTATSDPDAAKEQVRHDKLDGLLTIGRNPSGDLVFDYFTKALPTSASLQLVQQAVARLAISDRLEQAGVAQADRARIFAPVAFVTTAADPIGGRRNAEEFANSYILATVLVVLTFMAVQIYGNWVAVSVAEEKSSRVMELLISAATPRQLLAGKVLGNGAAGLTQYAALLAAGGIGLLLSGTLAKRLLGSDAGNLSAPALTFPLIVGFGVFFLTGFLLYSILYAAAGSLVSRQEDVQQMVGPLTVLGLGGYLVSFFAISVIDAPWVKVISFIPFVSTFIFPARLVLSAPATWEFALALGLVLAAMAGTLWLAARIYEAGVLQYGQRPSLRAIWRVALARR